MGIRFAKANGPRTFFLVTVARWACIPFCLLGAWTCYRGPLNYQQAADPNFVWTDFSKATGVSYFRSMVTMAHIRDGTSLTYLVGENNVCWSGMDPLRGCPGSGFRPQRGQIPQPRATP